MNRRRRKKAITKLFKGMVLTPNETRLVYRHLMKWKKLLDDCAALGADVTLVEVKREARHVTYAVGKL